MAQFHAPTRRNDADVTVTNSPQWKKEDIITPNTASLIHPTHRSIRRVGVNQLQSQHGSTNLTTQGHIQYLTPSPNHRHTGTGTDEYLSRDTKSESDYHDNDGNHDVGDEDVDDDDDDDDDQLDVSGDELEDGLQLVSERSKTQQSGARGKRFQWTSEETQQLLASIHEWVVEHNGQVPPFQRTNRSSKVREEWIAIAKKLDEKGTSLYAADLSAKAESGFVPPWNQRAKACALRFTNVKRKLRVRRNRHNYFGTSYRQVLLVAYHSHILLSCLFLRPCNRTYWLDGDWSC